MDPEVLIEKLPLVLDWVDELLARHRGNALTVGELPFSRLPHYYARPTLDYARVVVVEHLPVLPLTQMGLVGFEEFENLDAAGITFRDTFFVLPSRQHDESLHFHELVHVLQWQVLRNRTFCCATHRAI